MSDEYYGKLGLQTYLRIEMMYVGDYKHKLEQDKGYSMSPKQAYFRFIKDNKAEEFRNKFNDSRHILEVIHDEGKLEDIIRNNELRKLKGIIGDLDE